VLPVRASTNTNIQRFPVVAIKRGDALEETDSATLGTSVKILVAGIYIIGAAATGFNGTTGIKRNTALNNNLGTADDDWAFNLQTGAQGGSLGGPLYCLANDLIWVCSAGALNLHPSRAYLTIYGPLPLAD
jgi:hypothetical protein